MKFALSTALFATAFTVPALAETVMTGDLLQGVPVISQLNATALEDGDHQFWFRGGQDTMGGTFEIPVLVKKSGDGPTIFLQASLHGDELSGAQAIFELFKDLNDSETQIHGTIVAVTRANPTGMPLHSRYWYSPASGGSQTDLNRIMPGSETSSNSGSQWAYALWNHLYMPSQPDFFFDLHTTARGASFPYFIYADRSIELVDQIMAVTPADIIKNDPGVDGCVETEMNKAGVPAVTLEVGSFKTWNKEINLRAVRGIKNGMILMGMLDAEVDTLDHETFECDTYASVRTSGGGYVETIVELEEDVEEGQELGYLYNGFGQVVETYAAPTAGRVTTIAADPLREKGATVLRLCYMDDTPEEEVEEEKEGEPTASPSGSTVGVSASLKKNALRGHKSNHPQD